MTDTQKPVIVCGGRDYNDWKRLYNILDNYVVVLGFNAVIQGGARGADMHAKNWARQNGINVIEYTALWDDFGKAAGYIRNKDMAKHKPKPIAVIAFPGGKGTENMKKIAREFNIEVIDIEDLT